MYSVGYNPIITVQKKKTLWEEAWVWELAWLDIFMGRGMPDNLDCEMCGNYNEAYNGYTHHVSVNLCMTATLHIIRQMPQAQLLKNMAAVLFEWIVTMWPGLVGQFCQWRGKGGHVMADEEPAYSSMLVSKLWEL